MSERGRKDRLGARAQASGASNERRGGAREPLMILGALVMSVGVLYSLGFRVSCMGSFDEGEDQRTKARRAAERELYTERSAHLDAYDDPRTLTRETSTQSETQAKRQAKRQAEMSEAEARRKALQAKVREGMKARASDLLELSPESALEKTAHKPLGAKVSTLSPPSSDAWRAGQALPVRATEVPLAEGSGVARVSLSLSAQSAEGQRVALALRPKVRDSLHFLLSHRAPGALSLPEARERLERDLNERLARMSPQHELYVSVDELELSELEERAPEASP